jgi:hypothetical protein
MKFSDINFIDIDKEGSSIIGVMMESCVWRWDRRIGGVFASIILLL